MLNNEYNDEEDKDLSSSKDASGPASNDVNSMVNMGSNTKEASPHPVEDLKTPEDTEVMEKIKEIIFKSAGIKEEEKAKLTLASLLTTDLGLDSIDFVEVIMALEEHFDIEIPDADAQKISTLSDVVDYIKSKLKK